MLYQAVMDNDTEAVRSQLLSQEVDVDVRAGPTEETPLHLAVKNGNIEIAKLLVNYPTNLDVKNKFGKTALQYAVGSCDHEMEKILLKAEAEIKTVDNAGRTLMHEAAASANNSMIEYLLSRDISINAADLLGMTPLHLAADQNEVQSHLSTIQLLLQRGADPLALDKKFNKPIDYLVKEPKLEVSQLLISSMRKKVWKIRKPLKINVKVRKDEKSEDSFEEIGEVEASVPDAMTEEVPEIESLEESSEEEGMEQEEETSVFNDAADELAEIEITEDVEEKGEKENFENTNSFVEVNTINAVTEKQNNVETGNSLCYTIVTHLSVFLSSILLYFLFQYIFSEL